MNVAVIPARGGSKRIPKKNIKTFCGKPMINWPIDMAIKSGLFKHIIVSTDDEKIAKVSKACGAEVPFMRPAELSDDYTGTTEVMAHAVSWMHEKKWKPEAVCCIYATSVFLRKDDLVKGFDILNNGKWKYVFSVTEFASTIFRSFKQHPEGGVEMFFPEHFEKRSQDFPVALHDAAQFYWGQPSAWCNNLKMYEPHSFPIKIPSWRVQDIDTEDDWKRAEFLHNLIRKGYDG